MPAPIPSASLKDKIALVTGAGRGIGRATAEALAAEGACVVLCSRTAGELKAAVRGITAHGGTAVGRRADIGSFREARQLVGFTVRRFGRLDVLINNAGILGPRVAIAEFPIREWDRVLRINLTGTFYLTREAARVMTRQGGGCIISVSSSIGRVGRARWGAYAISKFGTEGLMQVLADEVQSANVSVMTFNPGGTRTRMRAEAYPEEDPSGLRDPALVAQALVRLTAQASPAISGRAFDMGNIP